MENNLDNGQLDVLVNNAAEGMAPAASEGKGTGNNAGNAHSNKAGFISVQKVADYIAEGKRMEAPKELVSHLLVEGETTILFSDTGLGKSTLAMQVACEVAEQDKRVMYVNFELSQQQWAMRNPDKEFPETLFIANINYSEMHDVTEQSQILDLIQQQSLEHGTEVVIVDNLTNLCVNSKEGSEAGNIMLQLLSLRMTHKWTMLILAHVPKRKPGDPLSLNDLAGSKILSNLADNVVGMNRSKKDKQMRYIIQLKSRSFPIELDYKNVQELTLTNSDGWLHFEFGGYDEERSHLPRSRDEKAELERDIVRALKEPNGKSYREIADELGTSITTISRVAKNNGLGKKTTKDSKS